MGKNGPVSLEGESYEQWRERTAPAQPVRPVDTRPWHWGAIALLGLFFVWVGGGTRAWIGLALVAVLALEAVLERAASPGETRDDRALRAGTFLVTMVLGAALVWVEGGAAVFLPVLLVLLDVKDDRSILRFAVDRVRNARGAAAANGPKPQKDSGPPA